MIAWILLAAVAAVSDWWAVHTGRRLVESVAKPAVMIALIGLVATTDLAPPGARPWLLAALTLGLVGDLALLPQIDRFIVGLGSFLVGHLAYVVAFTLIWRPTAWLLLGFAGLAVMLGVFGRPIERSIRSSGLRLPVIAYIGVTCIVVMAGAGTGRGLVAVGALTFALSDGILGWNKFVSPTPDRRVWVHMLYHAGQAAIVAGFVVGFVAGAPGT